MTSQYEKLVDAGNAKTSSLSNNLLDLTSRQTQHKIERDNARQNIVCFFVPSRIVKGPTLTRVPLVIDQNSKQDLSR